MSSALIVAGARNVLSEVESAISTYNTQLTADPVFGGASVSPDTADASKPAPKMPKVDLEGVLRPNGDVYMPRHVKALSTTDVQFVQRAYDNRMPVLLYGPPGTGKTALYEAALTNLITMMGTSETETSDFIGTWVQDPDGKYKWVDGPLIVAMENGWPLLIDEIALIDARTMSVVYSVMDGRDELPITANPARGVAKVKEGFVVYGACNPNVPGALMSDALLSRFKVHVEVTSDWDLAKRLGVGAKILTVAKNLEKKARSSEVVAPPQIRELLTFQQISDVYGEDVAVRNFLSQARPEDRAQFAQSLSSTFGMTPEPLNF